MEIVRVACSRRRAWPYREDVGTKESAAVEVKGLCTGEGERWGSGRQGGLLRADGVQ